MTSIKSQLGEAVGISVESRRRDTFPAIALATAYLHDCQGVPEDDVVIVCPVDPYVEAPFFQTLRSLEEQAEQGAVNLMLIGIEPTYPSEKYGYIIFKSSGSISNVLTFKEKSNISAAEKYIADGALWNAGVFAYKLKYGFDIAANVLGTSSYQELFNN